MKLEALRVSEEVEQEQEDGEEVHFSAPLEMFFVGWQTASMPSWRHRRLKKCEIYMVARY